MINTTASAGAVAALVLIATCAGPISAQDTKSLNGMGTTDRAGFVNSNETANLDCAGGTAAMLGDNNTLTINGACSAFELMGSRQQDHDQFRGRLKDRLCRFQQSDRVDQRRRETAASELRRQQQYHEQGIIISDQSSENFVARCRLVQPRSSGPP
jgi:hypothetical protein